MEIEEQKKAMIAFRDFHGGDLLDIAEVEQATSKEELAEIIDKHYSFLENVHTDALSHLEKFRKKIGLTMLDFD